MGLELPFMLLQVTFPSLNVAILLLFLRREALNLFLDLLVEGFCLLEFLLLGLAGLLEFIELRLLAVSVFFSTHGILLLLFDVFLFVGLVLLDGFNLVLRLLNTLIKFGYDLSKVVTLLC